MIYNNIIETIGNTPVVKVNNMGPKDQNIFVKCEAFNPLASVKDRLALAIVNDAEKSGKLKPGQTVIEATSEIQGLHWPWAVPPEDIHLSQSWLKHFPLSEEKL